MGRLARSCGCSTGHIFKYPYILRRTSCTFCIHTLADSEADIFFAVMYRNEILDDRNEVLSFSLSQKLCVRSHRGQNCQAKCVRPFSPHRSCPVTEFRVQSAYTTLCCWKAEGGQSVSIADYTVDGERGNVRFILRAVHTLYVIDGI